ncbi:MAG: ATP-binding protein [Desulfatitalea sp.]|nr:ATP-binding protein [Desulfatitalea sp.]
MGFHFDFNTNTGASKCNRPTLLALDDPGIFPIDKAFKDWLEIFNNDSTLTSAILDRLLHHAETVVIQGKSYRMKEKIEI